MRPERARLEPWVLLLGWGIGSSCGRGDQCPELPEPRILEGRSPLLRCDFLPALCDLAVDSVVREPDLDLAIDVVFLSDGHTDAMLGAYRARVDELVGQLTADTESIVGRDPTLFNFHRVDLVAPGSEASSRPLRSCVFDGGGDDPWILGGDDYRVERAAASAPAVDLVVVLVASGDARASAAKSAFGTPIVRMPDEGSHRVLTHELGHALVGLADEYVDFDERHPLSDRYERWTRNPLPPNLSLQSSGDWSGLVEGAVEGGGRYAFGVYRPTNRCRMLDSDEEVPFCPVCSAAVDGVLGSRRGVPDAPPRCGLAAGRVDRDGRREVLAFGRDADGLATVTLTLEGAPIEVAPSKLEPLASRVPSFEIGSSVTATLTEVRAGCVDALGAASTAILRLSP